MPLPRNIYAHIPPGREPGALSRDYPGPRGALVALLRPSLSGVTVSLERTEFRRGEAVRPELVGEVSREMVVGLVCLERYLVVERHGFSPSFALEWESWQPTDGTPSLEIPAEAPYSHEGSVLSISWEVVVRAPRRRRPDLELRTPIWVCP